MKVALSFGIFEGKIVYWMKNYKLTLAKFGKRYSLKEVKDLYHQLESKQDSVIVDIPIEAINELMQYSMVKTNLFKGA